MTKLEISMRSPAFWSMIGAIAVQVLTVIQPQLTGTASSIVSAVLAILALYLHPSEVKMAGMTGKLGGKTI